MNSFSPFSGRLGSPEAGTSQSSAQPRESLLCPRPPGRERPEAAVLCPHCQRRGRPRPAVPHPGGPGPPPGLRSLTHAQAPCPQGPYGLRELGGKQKRGTSPQLWELVWSKSCPVSRGFTMGAPSAWGSWGPPSLMGRGGAFSPDGGPAGTCVVGSACAAARGLQGGGGSALGVASGAGGTGCPLPTVPRWPPALTFPPHHCSFLCEMRRLGEEIPLALLRAPGKCPWFAEARLPFVP